MAVERADKAVDVAVKPKLGWMPTVNAVPSGEKDDERNERLFAPSSRIRSPVLSGCAIISFAEPGTPFSVRNAERSWLL